MKIYFLRFELRNSTKVGTLGQVKMSGKNYTAYRREQNSIVIDLLSLQALLHKAYLHFQGTVHYFDR